MRLWLPLLWAGALLAQQPILYNRGTVNAASLAPPGLPNASIAAGSLFSIFGENLGPATPQSVTTFPLGATYLGVSINVTQGSVTVPAYPIFVSPGQVNAVMPSSVTAGLASVRLTYQSNQSNAITVTIANAAPGIFALSSGGFGPGIFQNYSAAGIPTVNSYNNPAVPGQVVVIWATGLGPVSFPDNQPAAAGNLPTPVSITIGGQPAANAYSGRAPGYAGVDQINVTIPQNAPLGCWVPVTVNAAGVVSNTATIAIAAPGAASCSDPGNPLSAMVRTPGSQALIALTQIDDINYLSTSPPDTRVSQEVYARFYTRPDTPYNFDPYMSYPPAGTCLVHQAEGDTSVTMTLRGALPAGASLNPQPNQTYNNGTQSLLLPTDGPFFGDMVGVDLDSTSVGMSPPGQGASFTIDPGGPNQKVLAVTPASAPAWNRPASTLTVRHNAPLALSFTPADSSAPTAIVLYAYAAPINATVEVECMAAPGATTFQISADTLSNLPLSYRILDSSYALLMIGTTGIGNAVPFSNGLASSGLLLTSSWKSQWVVLQ